MRFLKRHQYVLIFLCVLVFCGVMVIRQYLVNERAHADLREDFILLHDEGHTQPAERLYQMLVQDLPRIPDRMLLDDDQRLAFVLASKTLPTGDLLWKYQVSVRNELERRIHQRISRALQRAGGD